MKPSRADDERLLRTRRELRQAQQELERAVERERAALRALDAARGLAALLARVNHVIASAVDERAMLAEVCALAVEHGGFELAWIAAPDPAGWFRTLAASGAVRYLERVHTSVNPELAEGNGCMGSAWRDGAARFNQSIQGADSMRPWKESARHHGLGAVAALPVLRDGGTWAVMTVYHRNEGIFDSPTRAVLEQLALGISRGIDRIAREAAQRQQDLLHQVLLDNAVAGVTMTRGNRIVSANACFAEMLGYDSVDALIDQPTSMLYVNTHELDRVRALYARMYDAKTVQLLSVQLKSRDGQRINCDISGRLLPQPEGKPIAVWTVVDVTQRDEQTELLRRLQADAVFRAQHDALTGLPNRYALEQFLQAALADAQRQGNCLVVGMIDLDDFKPVNDTFGHAAGDQLLRQFALRVKRLLRGSDFIARLGGDEFVVVFNGIEPDAPRASALAAIRRLRVCVDKPFKLAGDHKATVRMTLGAAVYPHDAPDASTLLRVADAAMYRAKARKDQRRRWWCLASDDD